MLFSLFYNIALLLLAGVYAPKAIYQFFALGKYRNSIAQRLGRNFPLIQKGSRQLVWIHAVSLGETKAIAPLAKMLKEKLDNPIIIVSSVTSTGHVEAKRAIPFAEHHVYLPFDFSWVIKPIMAQCAPDLIVLSESDLWYHFLKYAKKAGAKVLLANGKISERSCARMQKWKFFSRPLLSLLDVLCVQASVYQHRFEAMGVPSEKIIVTGNLKFDDDVPPLSHQELLEWKTHLGIHHGQLVLVVGSTHAPEEKLILSVMKEVWQRHPKLKLILVPRHPERFDEVVSVFEAERIPFIRFTQLKHKTGHERVILMDTMGLLRKCYQVADVAIVGGCYTSKVGGHNIVEPSWYGVPVIYGPHMHSQPDLVTLMQEYRAGIQVEIGELLKTIDHLLHTPEARRPYKEASAALIKNCQGATERTWQMIKNMHDDELKLEIKN